MPQHGAGMMGPPSKPPEKKDNESDAMDILNGTGIDLKEEEQYMINNSFNHELTRSHAGFATAAHSYSQFPPGNAASFYGAGPANAPAESADGKSQEEYIRLAADTRRLAMSREREIYDPFLFTMLLQKKVDKAAREQGLTIRAGGWVLPENFHNSTVDVKTAVGPSGSMVQTNGRFLSEDAQLADQSALLSLATKQRLLGFIEDAAALAKARQTGSHGIVPEEWTDVAAPVDLSASTIVSEGGVRVGWESAVDPASASRKRSASGPAKMPTPVSDSVKTPSDGLKMANDVVVALRAIASKERDYEEARLQKRNARAAGVGTTSRQGSILPGTPGSIAPEASEKAPTKKEQTKKAQAKVNEAANHAAANQTTNQFLGGGGDKLTSDGVRRVGAWREDHDKGKGIQLRDWIAVLEEDGREKRALQLAYMNLDDSGPK
ncbi:hypothetical protein M7I_4683 [Glarea lozoyensis 74030]|uniref:Transcription initiation factor TFIID subunit 4 n=1 Tax=Glarea lozoyensis (strain ATCC 74030 / MF5533) TaxID=1104152 RepID=H0EPU5_GLAL7|nr:hypothetical protein M7I_4683 [Glarea lozoyensis 74030]